MSFPKWPMAIGLAVALFALALLVNAAEDSGLEVLPDRTFIHKEAKTTLKVPTDWTIIAPYRLRKASSLSILGLEKEYEGKDKGLMTVTIVWSPIGRRNFDEIIQATSDKKKFGEEYALLETVYKTPDKLTPPTTIKVGKYTVFKVLIDDGPTDRDGPYSGALYLFEAGDDGAKWKVRIRAVFPQQTKRESIKQIEELIGQFAAEK